MNPPVFQAAAKTDVGCKRRNNEDSVLSLPGRGVYCVADGMGGAREGHVASKAMTDALSEAFSSPAADTLDLDGRVRLVKDTVQQVNTWIKNRVEERGFTQMGTTVVVGLFDNRDPSRGVVLNAGDSRMYCYRARALRQITADHTFVAEVGVKNEKALPAEFRGVVTKAVGLRDDLQLDELPLDVQCGDIFILCSDGLTRMLADKFLQKLLRQHDSLDPLPIASLLVDEARKAGGDDNISVIVVKAGRESGTDGAVAGTQGEAATASTATVAPVVSPDVPATDPGEHEADIAEADSADRDTIEGNTPNSGQGNVRAGPSRMGGNTTTRCGNPLLVKVVGAATVLAVAVFGWVVFNRGTGRGGKAQSVLPPDGHGQVAGVATSPSALSAATQAVVEAVSSVATQTELLAMSATSPALVATNEAVASVVSTSVMTSVSAVQAPDTNAGTGLPGMMAGTPVAPAVQEGLESKPFTPADSTGAVAAVKLAHTDTNAVMPASTNPPVSEALANVQEDREKLSLGKARMTWSDMRDHVGRSGKWGLLREELGPWWSKLEQVEPDPGRRAMLVGWTALWDQARGESNAPPRIQVQMAGLGKIAEALDVRLPPVVQVEGDGATRANALCRAYHEQQCLLLKGLEAFVSKHSQPMAAMSEGMEAGLVNLWTFLDGASSASGYDGILERLVKAREQADKLGEWGRAKTLAAVPLAPDQYPLAEINQTMEDADAAWDKLFALVEPLGGVIAFKRNAADDATNDKLDRIDILQKAIVVERGNFSSARQWRVSSNPIRLRNLLMEVSNVVTSRHPHAASSN